MINRFKFVKWLNLPKGDTVKLQKRGERVQAQITTGNNTLTYWVQETAGSYTLNDTANPTVVSDHNGSRDPEEYAEASTGSTVTEDVAERNDSLSGELQDAFQLDAEQADAIAQWHCRRCQEASTTARAHDLVRLIEVLLTRQNPRLAAAGMAYAAGLDGIAGKPMTETARELSVTRQAVSKEANFWSDALKLPRSRYMKSARARVAYRTAQLKRGGRGNARKGRTIASGARLCPRSQGLRPLPLPGKESP